MPYQQFLIFTLHHIQPIELLEVYPHAHFWCYGTCLLRVSLSPEGSFHAVTCKHDAHFHLSSVQSEFHELREKYLGRYDVCLDVI